MAEGPSKCQQDRADREWHEDGGLHGQTPRWVSPVGDPVVEDKCPVVVLLVMVLLLLFCSALLENLSDFSIW